MSAGVDWILWLLTLALCGGCLLLGFVLGRDSGRRSAESHQERRALPGSPSYPGTPVRLHMASTARPVYEITGPAKNAPGHES